MLRFLLKRLLWGVLTLFLFQTLIFFLANVLIPGDWVTQFSLGLSAEQQAALREELGLSLPLWQQYLNWLRNFFSGSLGVASNGQPVWEIIRRVLPPTLIVFLPGTVIAFLLGFWLGKVTAWKRNVLTSATTLGGIVLYTSFPAWLAFLALYFLGRRLDQVRSLLVLDPTGKLWREAALPPAAIIWRMLLGMLLVGLLLFLLSLAVRRWLRRPLPVWLVIPLFLVLWIASWYLQRIAPYAIDVLYHYTLPILTYVLLSFGETMLIMRTNMLDTLNDEYITTARAKGVPERLVRDKHAARNALLPVLSRFVISLPYLLTGLVIIEHAFSFTGGVSGVRGIQSGAINFQGMGWAFYMALYLQDLPIVLGALFVVGVLAVVARLVLDLLHAYLDPRIRYQTRVL